MSGDLGGWWDALAEGVVLLAGDRVADLNAAAARLLDVDRARARGAVAIAVLRDHRLEAMWASGQGGELSLRSRMVRATVTRDGLVLEDITALREERAAARDLLAVLSHELRTPVTVIRGAIEALEPREAATAGAGDDAHFVRLARAEAERLSRLLDDLTVESRPPRERRVPVADVVRRALSLLREPVERSGAELVVKVDELMAWVDEDKLLQVVLNLVENAVIHGSWGGRIEVAAWREPGAAASGPEPAGRLEVRGSGTPLDPVAVPALFTPRGRGRGASQGAGLGLYVVRSIAERWGGAAWGGPHEWGPGGVGGANAFGVSFPLVDGG